MQVFIKLRRVRLRTARRSVLLLVMNVTRVACYAPTSDESVLTRPSKKDLLLEQIFQDLETRTSQQPRTRAFMEAPLRHGICNLRMQGPLGEDPTRISRRFSVESKDL